MAKCVCLYAAPDESAVRRAREVVSAPVDRLTRLCS
ncbi:nickel-binding protein [Thermomicrobium sp. 4228-Ro]